MKGSRRYWLSNGDHIAQSLAAFQADFCSSQNSQRLALFGQFQTRYAELFRKTLGKAEELQVQALLLSVDFA